MLDSLLLLSGNDIPFIEAQVNIHQPTIKEISLISEESFHIGCQFLIFSLDSLSEQDKISLGNKTDFEVFMSIMNSKEKVQYRSDALSVLTLLFPDYEIKLTDKEIFLMSPKGPGRINNFNFTEFKEIISDMFVLNDLADGKGYNPADAYAKKIAEKLNKAKQKIAKEKGENIDKIAIFSRYVSILAVGEHKDMNSLMNLTVPQLKNEFQRYQLKYQNDIYLQARMAGAQDLEEVEDWMQAL